MCYSGGMVFCGPGRSSFGFLTVAVIWLKKEAQIQVANYGVWSTLFGSESCMTFLTVIF